MGMQKKKEDTASWKRVPQKATKAHADCTPLISCDDGYSYRRAVAMRQKPLHTINSRDMKKRDGWEWLATLNGNETHPHYVEYCGPGLSSLHQSLLSVFVLPVVGHLSCFCRERTVSALIV